MFDRVAAEDGLFRTSKRQIDRFLAEGEQDGLYGFGFFCDAFDETVLLVANTEQFHLTSIRSFEAEFGPTDPEIFRWDIGNWKYPAGLFPPVTAEQNLFEVLRKESLEPLSEVDGDDKQGMLEEICFNVLRRLIRGRTFSPVSTLRGVTVLGPTLLLENVLDRKKRLDSLFTSADEEPEQRL